MSSGEAPEDPAHARFIIHEDITAFANRMAHQQRTGEMTPESRLRLTRRIFRLLNDLHALGITDTREAAPTFPRVASSVIVRTMLSHGKADRRN